jgi:hypothetical protein
MQSDDEPRIVMERRGGDSGVLRKATRLAAQINMQAPETRKISRVWRRCVGADTMLSQRVQPLLEILIILQG